MITPVLAERDRWSTYPTPYDGRSHSPSLTQNTQEEESFKSIWRVLRKRKYWIICSILTGILLAIVACILQTPQYSGIATIQVGKDETVEVHLLPAAGSPALDADDLKTDIATHIAVLEDDNTALAVINDLQLEKYRPFAFHPSIIGWIDGSNARIKAEQGLPLSQAPARRARLLKIFGNKLKVDNPPDTRLITVAYLNPDPKLAADIANTLVQEYVRFESRSQSTGEAFQWLQTQLNELKSKVDTSQQELVNYEQKTGLNNLLLASMGQANTSGGVTHIPVLDKLDTINQELTAAEATRVAKEAIYHLTQTQNPDVIAGLASSGLPDIGTSAAIAQGNGLELLQNLRQQQATLKLAYADATTRYGNKNPRLIELQTQLSNINQQIAAELQNINTRARNDYILARQNENGLKAEFDNQEQMASTLNERAVQLQVLAQQATSSRELYDALYGKLQETNVQAALRATNIRIADRARVGAVPKWPNPPIYLAIGLAAGFLFGLSSAFIREHMDETVSTPLQIIDSIHLPVLANIPLSRGQQRLPSSSSISSPKLSVNESSLLITQSKSPTAEAYRSLRTAIALSPGAGAFQTLLIASALVGEGKTSVAYNTAIAFAYAGKRVLLIDADMRRPHLHKMFGVKQAPGLSEVLSAGQSVESLVHPHATVPNLFLLTAGAIPSMPAELLGSARFDEIMHALKQKYNMIVLDTPPMLLVTDASILSRKMDATLFVVQANVTTRTTVSRVAEILERNGCRAIGLVLNGVDTKSIDYYLAYGFKGGGSYYEEN